MVIAWDGDENDHTATMRRGNVDDDDAPVVIVNLPLSSLISGERSCELPPRNLEFALLVPREYARLFQLPRENDDAKEGGGGDCPIRKLFFSSRSESTGQSRRPWLVREVLIDDDELWRGASALGCILRGEGGWCGGGFVDEGIPFRRLPRLWKPDPLMSSDVLPLLKAWYTKACDSHPVEEMNDERLIHRHAAAINAAEIDSDENDPMEPLGLVWDLGCGAGRDICYLAEEIKEFRHSLPSRRRRRQSTRIHIHFYGIDNHRGSERRCVPLWKNRGVDDIADAISLDLTKLHRVRDIFTCPPTSARSMRPRRIPDAVFILAIRYLNRKVSPKIPSIVLSSLNDALTSICGRFQLFSYIAESRVADGTHASTNIATTATFARISKDTVQSLPPPLELPHGAVVAISHFCKPEEGARWDFDHPRESNVLERYELRRLFGGDAAIVDDVNADRGKRRWHILRDDLIIDGDHGRTMIQFVARMVA